MPRKALKVAVFGTGYWASLQIPSWISVGAEVTAVWNRTHEKAVAVAENFGIPKVYRGLEEAFSDAEYDVADIITEVEGHYPLVMMAASYQKPVICQKPLAGTFEECREMAAACEKNHTWFAVHENFRYRQSLRRIKQILDEGTLGRVFWANITMRSLSRKRFEESPHYLLPKNIATQVMGPHIFDVTRFFFGDAKSIYCAQTTTFPDLGTLDTILAVVTMKSGVLVQCSLCTGSPPGIYISGEKGSLTLDERNTLTVARGGVSQLLEYTEPVKPDFIPQKSWEYHGGEGMLSIAACLEDLQRSFLAGVPAKTSGADYLKTMELVFEANTSFDMNEARALS